MTLLIGCKSRVAIEFSIKNHENLIGCAKLWINNSFFGSLDDTIFFDGYFIGGVNEILCKKPLDKKYKLDSPLKIYESLNNDILSDGGLSELATSYRVNFGSWSDYFNIYTYSVSEDTGVILWQLFDKNDELKDLIDYPLKVFNDTFNYSELRRVINDFYFKLSQGDN